MTGPTSDTGDAGGARPTLRVVAGDATPEEIAALVAALAVATAADAPPPVPAARSIWAARSASHRSVRTTFTPGPDAWRTSSWPR